MLPRRRFTWWPVLTILVLVCTFQMISAQTLITRNDFVAYDSSFGNPWITFYPDVAIDGSGQLKQLTWIRDASIPFPETRLSAQVMLNLMTPNGDILQEASPLVPIPFSEGGGQFITYSRSRIDANEAGLAAVAFAAKGYAGSATTHSSAALFLQIINADGQVAADPVQLITFEVDEDIFGGFEIPSLHVSGSGLVGVVAKYRFNNTVTHESTAGVAVFVYDPSSGIVSPMIDPTDRPHPMESEPEYDGNYQLEPATAIGLADDGSLAVAWMVRDDGYHHVSLARYDADLNPVGEITMPDCEAGFFDPDQCTTPLSQRVAMGMESDGDFYLAWFGDPFDALLFPKGELYVRGYNADGSTKYGPFNVADDFSLNQHVQDPIHPIIACNDSGHVIISWSDSRLDPDPTMPPIRHRTLFAQKIDPAGNLVGLNYRIDNHDGPIDWYGWYSDCDLNNAGQAVFTWKNHDLELTIRAQLMPYHDIGTYVPGDIDYDFEATIADLVALVDYMFNSEPNSFWPPSMIDFDGNGSNGDISDLVLMVDWMFSGGVEPMTPDEGVRIPL